jgi:hypothetical protein
MADLYLGRTVSDSKKLLYQSRDLVTHGVCVGMTGSGKTGLCIDLLEEALLSDIPLFIIDPKGDVTNLLLLFPDLAPQDFARWADPPGDGTAQAKLWREGLAKWDVPVESIRRLKEGTTWRVFTPGSRVVRPVNLLGSLDAPSGADEETLRDEVRGLVSGLLGLARVEADSLSDPRAILLSRLVEREWSAGRSLDLRGLVAFVKNPQLDRVGAVPLEEFLPRERRQELALALNNLLASPDFESWREGKAIDPEKLSRGEDGRAACNLFYLAHLDDRERMFFVSRFLDRLWSWTRTRTGTSELRAILYFDEVMGFLPPVAEPPSKRPLLSLLKQGRAFGVGSLLVTQNPVDLDYKALTNAGTWMIGRLQAERDKERLLDGLDSAGIGMSRAEADRTISGLEKRKFLLHDVHRPGGPVVFESRWARAYLRGPLALRELPALVETAGAEEEVVGPGAERDVKPIAGAGEREGAPVPPSLDPAFRHVYLAPGAASRALTGEVAALVETRVARQRPPVSGTARVLVRFGSGGAPVPALGDPSQIASASNAPPSGAAYGPLPGWATKANATSALERLAKAAVSSEGMKLDGVPSMNLYRAPEETAEDFANRVKAAVDASVAKARGPLTRKLESLDRKIEAETHELERDRAESSRSKTYSAIDVGASILTTVLGGRRSSIGSAGRAGARAYGRIQRSAENIKESERKIAEWTAERDGLAAEIQRLDEAERRRLQGEAGSGEKVRVPVNRADIRALEWYVLWS